MRHEYVLKLMENGERVDKRKLDQFRDIKVETGVIKRAEGSARVKIGKTDVLVGVKTGIGQPFADVPNEGILKVEAEFTPLAAPEFEPGPPDENATELARVVDRGIRESHCIDLEKLCIKEGEKVWEIFVDVNVMNHDGNLIDASALAAIAALKNTKMPELKDDKIDREKLSKKLPLSHTPITITIGKIFDKFIIDPLKEEEEVFDSKIMIAVMEDGKICAIQKSGEEGLSFEDIDKMIDLAVKKTKELRKLV